MMFEKKIPADLEQLSGIADEIDRLMTPLTIPNKEQSTYAVKMAVHELLVNVIEHGYEGKGGEIGVKLSAEKGKFIAVITERGKKFKRSAVPTPDFEGLQVRGFGTFLIEELMDDVQYQSRFGRNKWRLVKRLA